MHGEVDLEQACRDLDACHPPPYWAFCWGAGQALARFVLDRPDTVRDQHVVDFGTGSGVVALAAALSGAARVTAVDIDPLALAAVARNAARNGAEVATASSLPADFDVLLAADVLYEACDPDWITTHRNAGRRVIISDPERSGAPRLGAPAAARYAARTEPDVDSPMCGAAVFVL